MTTRKSLSALLALAGMATALSPALAHKLREKGAPVAVAESPMTVTPSRAWNRLDHRIGKNTETWTLDGAPLNDVTFFAGVAPGMPLVRERSKKHNPLPKFSKQTLLVEVPELLEGTIRTSEDVGTFEVTSAEPKPFMGQDGVMFTYQFTDQGGLPRKGEAQAAIVGGKLYMITYDAPRLHYFDKSLADFRALAQSARFK